MNKLLFLCISASLIFLSGSAFSQDLVYKIGFVNTSRVLKESPQAREVEEQLKSEFGPRETQLKDKRSEILAIEEQIKSDELADSANSRRKLEREIR